MTSSLRSTRPVAKALSNLVEKDRVGLAPDVEFRARDLARDADRKTPRRGTGDTRQTVGPAELAAQSAYLALR